MLALEESGLALCLILCGVLLMLVLGTQILHWYWLAVLGIIGIGIAGYRVYIRRLPPYRAAQLIDSRLKLSDSLSTAWFLLSEKPRRQDAAARFQIARAEQIAAGVNAAGIFHFRGGRAWAGAGALAAVAFGLFTVRYLVTSSLSIQQAIVPLQMGGTIERIESRLGLQGRRDHQPGSQRPQGDFPAPTNQANKQTGVLSGERNMESGRENEAKMSTGASGTKAQPDEFHNQAPPGQMRSQNGISQASQRPSDTQLPQTASRDRASQQIANKEDEPGSNDQNSPGLVDKVREALSSLMAKLHPKESQNADQGNKGSAQDKKGDQMAAAKDRNGNLQQNARNSQSSQEQNNVGAMGGRTTEKAQTSQNQSSDDSSDQKSASSQSGIGHTNGDKGIKDAEQLKAMGKLAEIIGRRSANLTGDITVETSSTNQQLRTQYSGRIGEHADLGREINRDEIPVMYRDYVREYMQLVHKQAEQQR